MAGLGAYILAGGVQGLGTGIVTQAENARVERLDAIRAQREDRRLQEQRAYQDRVRNDDRSYQAGLRDEERAFQRGIQDGLTEDALALLRPGPSVGPVSGDRELLAKTIMAEAGGEGLDGMIAVGAVMANRAQVGGYGNSLNDVILRPGQFSAWNSVTGYAGGEGGLDMENMTPSEQAYAAADAILSGQYTDPTNGATHYYNPSVADPPWGQRNGGQWQTIGNHVFGSADGKRARAIARTIANPNATPQMRELAAQSIPQPDRSQTPELTGEEWIADGNGNEVLHGRSGNRQIPYVGQDGQPITRPVSQQTEDLSAAEEKIARLMETGLTREEAIYAAERTAISRDPLTGEAVLIDRATGQPVSPSSATPQAAPQGETLSFGAESPDTGFSASPESFGAGGLGRRVANNVSDVLGANVPFPEVQETQANFAVLKEQLTNDIVSGYPRQPPSWLLKNISDLVPEAGTLRRGPQGAKSDLEALRRSMLEQVQTIDEQLSRRLRPADRADLRSNKIATETAISRIDTALLSFRDPSGGGQTTSGGVNWRIVE